MDRSYPYSRRIARRAQGRRPFAALVLLGLAGCGVALALAFGPDRIAAATNDATPHAAPLALAGAQGNPSPRRVYPYSVVPGGVASQAELVRIVRSDKVVATHYANFDVDRAHEVSVATPRAVHVSYRKGDKVYWTAKKVMLREGETLLSDGKNEMRTRCANRISDVAQFPVEAHAPSAEVLDTAEGEEGSLHNASAAMVEEGEFSLPGEQPPLPALANASAAELASTTVERTSVTPGRMPAFTERFANRPSTPGVSAATPGAAQQAQEAAADDAISSAPALVVATEVMPSNEAAPDHSAPTPAPAASSPSAAQPGPAIPAPPVVAAAEPPRPTEVPEPGTVWLVALALGSMLLLRKR